jgi:hypothetical protein
MEYNLKEQLFDKIRGLEFVNPDEYGAKYNRGVREAKARVDSFFNKELEPEVPQYVADWYEENKKNLDYNIWNYIMDWEDTEEDSFKRWVNNSKDAFQTIINMHQFGYKIENGKKYLVKIKGDIQENILVYGYGVKRYFFSSYMYGNRRTYHTKEELEAGGFGGVFDNPMIEVEEVDE